MGSAKGCCIYTWPCYSSAALLRWLHWLSSCCTMPHTPVANKVLVTWQLINNCSCSGTCSPCATAEPVLWELDSQASGSCSCPQVAVWLTTRLLPAIPGQAGGCSQVYLCYKCQATSWGSAANQRAATASNKQALRPATFASSCATMLCRLLKQASSCSALLCISHNRR